MRSSLATVQLPLEEQERLVDRDELGEVRRVLRRRARDGLEPLAPTFAFVEFDTFRTKERMNERMNELRLIDGWDGGSGCCCCCCCVIERRWECDDQRRKEWRERDTLETYSPRPNKMAIINACGNLTLTPYTKPFRAPLRMAR